MDRQAASASAAPQSWTCPECRRRIPRQVDVCRCGVERRRLEELGVSLDGVPVTDAPVKSQQVRAVSSGLAQQLFGYRTDDDLAPGWRIALKAAFVVSVAAVGLAMVTMARRDPLPTRGNIQIVSTLDDFTEDAGPTAANTMPAFLALPGALGALGPSSDPDELVRDLDEAELQQGFCTQSVPRQIRHQYPGYYDSWPDDKLERVALEKYPELRDQLCTLPYKIDATPAGIIKYELKPRTVVVSGLWLLTLLVTGAFAVACLNLYYRFLVDRLASA